MQAALLSDRGVIRVSGDEARAFLDRLVTSSIDTLQPGAARFCALLTPQGKIIVDFIVTEATTDDGGGFWAQNSNSGNASAAANPSGTRTRSADPTR